ncbi:uncharacterized protein LOC108249013 isoform X2 [Kryptolebias marmoratus]|uniref:uncharacterized protein LOC108249013 isoform X2 n=1 Tax=Kryptolebias marmoratus TaxID=37003 RepID=UPI0018AC9B27|nr:uncharacterized protein LOC108249013 isoform X2 [Kryptolebias marmoratus]
MYLFGIVPVSLLAILCFPATSTQVNRMVGDTVDLHPGYQGGKITSVTWKHHSDIALEWLGSGDDDTFRQFKGRATLNKETGVMTIKDLIPELAGTYTAEINNKVLRSQILNVYHPVPKPTVSNKKVDDGTDCKLTCDYSTDPSISQKWLNNNKELSEPNPLTIEEGTSGSYVCMLTNPVSNASSEAMVDPCPSPGPGPVVAAVIVFLVFLLFLFLILCVIIVKTPKKLKENPTIKRLKESKFGEWLIRTFGNKNDPSTQPVEANGGTEVNVPLVRNNTDPPAVATNELPEAENQNQPNITVETVGHPEAENQENKPNIRTPENQTSENNGPAVATNELPEADQKNQPNNI